MAECALCFNVYSRLAPHLTAVHKVANSDEKRLLLALAAGRVDTRKTPCPVPGCRRTPARLDRHLRQHAELSTSGRKEAMGRAKRRKVARELQWLRSTQPAIPVVSQLASSSEGERDSEDPEAGRPCADRGCRRATERIQAQLTDLGKQVTKMRSTLLQITRLYRELRKGEGGRRRRKRARRTRSPPAPPPPGRGAAGGPTPPEPPEALEPTAYPFPDHVPALNLLLGEFEGYQLGSEPTPRLRNNVTSKLGRIKAFLGYMARGTAEPGDFLFLNQPARIRAWAARLGQTRMAEPTRQHYLKNVAQFLDYLSETPPAACQLSSTALVLIRREVRALIRGIRRRVVVHEVRTKQAKESRLIPKASLVRCHRTAGRKIPALLDSLESNPSTRQQWRFYGFLTGYLTSISGHRCGVFQNLTIQEVEEASRSPDESAYVINITTHKTNRAFGAAQLSLNREEYSWFRRFLALRAGLPGGSQATYFFFTSRASPCRTLNKYFQSAWLSMGLPGKPTFTDVRTAIATHVSRHCDAPVTTSGGFYPNQASVSLRRRQRMHTLQRIAARWRNSCAMTLQPQISSTHFTSDLSKHASAADSLKGPWWRRRRRRRMGRQRALKAPRGKGARGQRLPSLPWREPAGGRCHGALPKGKARALARSNKQKTLNRPE
ncbi:uncharacterized protein isoform X3 [Danio rerio]|uniref:Uncharacterized protein isoform X3 n=2 Tax=Danio rerio TaxID=7955 RepID=A0AB32TR71_DANRE